MSITKHRYKGMKPNWSQFLGWSILLGGLRGLDFYSTSLWFRQPGGYLDETNPLVSWFGIGKDWQLLWSINIALVILILATYWFYCFKYQPKAAPNEMRRSPLSLAKWQYYGRSVPTWQLLLNPPKHKRPAFAHLGFVGVRGLAMGSLLAGIHNLGQFYGWEVYSSFREAVGRPNWVIYFLVVLSVWISYRQVLKRDFDWVKNT